MRRVTRCAVTEGHPRGGPLLFLLALAALAGCGAGRGPARPEPVDRGPFGRPLETYAQIGLLAGPANEGIARQPEAVGEIRTNMIIAAALIEGLALFAIVICFLLSTKAGA